MLSPISPSSCVFCVSDGGAVLYRDEFCRVVLTDEPIPGFCRVILNEHVKEFTDLSRDARDHCMNVVAATEAALRKLMRPDKINIASFGNQTPHLHWHVIPRFRDDAWFPESIWGRVQREGAFHEPPEVDELRVAIKDALGNSG
jgi:diadenosine tetraphosphate (Ap4A) HIT family hydrolase